MACNARIDVTREHAPMSSAKVDRPPGLPNWSLENKSIECSGVAAAWNNNATNAGDASVLYLNAMLDLSGQKDRGNTKELVLTVPPSQNDYYVVNLLDAFINSVGSIGTRTTPSTEPQTYLLAGPTSRSTAC